jgi:hypothetical protein
MLKNGIVKALAVAAILGVAACNQNQEAPAVEEAPATETAAPAPVVAPAPEAEPMTADTVITEAPAEAQPQPAAPAAGSRY